MADAVARTAGGGSGPSKNGGEPGFGGKLVNFYHGVIAEMKKVTWPDLPQVRSATISIIVFVLLLALMITLMDFVLQGLLIKAIPSLFAGR